MVDVSVTGTLLPVGLALGLAAVHLLVGRLDVTAVIPRSRWLSVAGGASVAYVFVHLLPEVQEAAQTVDERGLFPAFLDAHVYLLALVGFATFYGLERFVRWKNESDGQREQWAAGVFWIHLAAFAVYNAFIGTVLVHRETPGVASLVMYALAMGLHFVVNDVGLRAHHGETYHQRGRWILAAAVVVGSGVGYAFAFDDLLLALLLSFLSGGVILNVIKEELPEERESRFWAFGAGAAGYTVLLIAI